MNLTTELDDLKEEIKAIAIDYGLDFFDVVFELCTYDQINQIAALGAAYRIRGSEPGIAGIVRGTQSAAS